MKKLVMSVGSVVGILTSVYGGTTWTGGSYGCVTNETNWGGKYPGLTTNGQFYVSGETTIVFPEGDWQPDDFGGFTFTLNKGSQVTVAGTNSNFKFATKAVDTYNAEPLQFIAKNAGSGRKIFDLEHYWGNQSRKLGPFAMSDFSFRVMWNNDDSTEMHFDRGTYNFADPEGTVLDGGHVFCGSGGTHQRVVIHDGTSIRFNAFAYHGSAATNEILFLAGHHYMIAGTPAQNPIAHTMPYGGANMVTDSLNYLDVRDTATLTITGASFTVGRPTLGGKLNDLPDRHHYLRAIDGGQFDFGGKLQLLGVSGYGEIDILNGGRVTMNGGDLCVGCGSATQFQTNTVVVDNGTLLTKDGRGLYLGGSSAAEPDTSCLWVTNGGYVQAKTLGVRQGGAYTMYSGTSVVANVALANGGHVDFKGGYVEVPTAFRVSGCGTVRFDGATTSISNLLIGVNNQNEARVILSDGTTHWGSFVELGRTANATGILEIVGGTHVFDATPDYAYDGDFAGTNPIMVGRQGVGRLVLSGGTTTFRTRKAEGHLSSSANVYFANDSSGRAEILVSGGSHTFDGVQNLYISVNNGAKTTWYQTGGDVNFNQNFNNYRADVDYTIAGGTFTTTGEFQMGGGASGTGTQTLTIDGDGAFTCAHLPVGNNASFDGTCRLILNGGVLTAQDVYGGGRSSSGHSYFEADGGKIVVSATGYQPVRNFDKAELGAKGLEICSDVASATIPQNYTNKEGEKGRLILSGSGTKYITGTDSREAVLVCAGGNVIFNEGARHYAEEIIVTNGACVAFGSAGTGTMITNLTVGSDASAGVLKIASGETLVVNGTASFRNVEIIATGDWTLGTTYDLLRVTGEVSEASLEAWALAGVRSGLADGQIGSFTWETDTATGAKVMKMTVQDSASATVKLELKEGTSNATEKILFGTGVALEAVVSNGAVLTVSGKLQRGQFQKKGGGRVILTNVGNQFYSGIVISEGMLMVTEMAALGFSELGSGILSLEGGTLTFGENAGGTVAKKLEVNAPTKTEAVVLNTESDVTITAAEVKSGAIVKRGKGKLTFSLPANTPMILSCGQGGCANAYSAPVNGPVVFDDDGTPPTSGYAGFTVAEGEVLLKGTDRTSTFYLKNQGMVGTHVPKEDNAEQALPVLTIDGATAYLGGSGALFYVGARAYEGDFATKSTMRIINGATVSLDTLVGAEYCTLCNTSVVEIVDSKLTCTYALWSGNFNCSTGYMLLTATNSEVSTGYDLYFRNHADMTFANTPIIGRANENYYTQLRLLEARGSLNLTQGSSIKCNKIIGSACGNNGGFTVHADGATWYAPAAYENLFCVLQPDYVHFVTTGDGLTIPVTADDALRVVGRWTGTGGITKTGAGMLTFGCARKWADADCTNAVLAAASETLDFTGVLQVQEGTVGIAQGAAREGLQVNVSAGAVLDLCAGESSGLVLSGTGTIRNGTLKNATFRAAVGSEAVPVLDAGVAYAGKAYVDLGRTADTALEYPYPQNTLVATYTGDTAPNVAWRLMGTGVEGAYGIFTAANGRVTCNIKKAGTCVIIR